MIKCLFLAGKNGKAETLQKFLHFPMRQEGTEHVLNNIY